MSEEKFKTVYIDPPWNEQGGGKIKRGADRHYPLMKTPDIIELLKKEILPKLDDSCHMYLWVTNNFLEDGFKVLRELGFNYITMITWAKPTMGLGQFFRGMSEHCLFARRGPMLPYKTENGKRQQGKTIFTAPKGKHSEKPIEMVEMIEKVSYPPYLEVFARDHKPGWSAWGNEVEEEADVKEEVKEEPKVETEVKEHIEETSLQTPIPFHFGG